MLSEKHDGKMAKYNEDQLALDIQSTSDKMCVVEIVWKGEKPKFEKYETPEQALFMAESYEKLETVLRVAIYECKLIKR